MNEATSPPASGRNSKTVFNSIVAGILSLLGVWMTIADFSRHGDLLFQDSASVILAALFASLLFMLLTILAAMPKRMIIGANCLLVFRCAMGFPLNAWLGNTVAGRIASAAFLVFSLYYFHSSLKGNQRLAARPWVQGRHSFQATLALLVVTVLSVPVLAFGYANAVANFAGNYAEISTTGVNLVERDFQKNGQTVHLVPMMHVGDGSYYSDLNKRMRAAPANGGKRLILTEGVADRNHILPADFASGKTYERLAKLFGLESQKKATLGPSAPQVSPTAPTAAPPSPTVADTTSDPGVTWQNADIDVSDLKESHREMLVGMLTAMSSSDLTKLLSSKVATMTGEQLEDLLRNGLLGARNDAMMQRFNAMNADYSDIYIPWGAAHLPDVEQRLLALGYLKTSEASRPIVKFWK